jgi:elongation factor G
VAPTLGIGLEELLRLMTRGFPSPLEHPIPPVTAIDLEPVDPPSCDPDGPLLAEVVKTTTDPYVGRLSLVRVFSGTMRPDSVVHVSGHLATFAGEERGHADHDEDERIGALSSPLGKVQRTVSRGIAGDIVAVAKLTRAETGDTLSDKEAPLLMEPWVLPDPLLPVAVTAASKADEDKLSAGLQRLVAEDPTLRLDRNPETHQVVLWTMGEAHVDVLLDRLANRYGVAVETVPLREAIRRSRPVRHLRHRGRAAAGGKRVRVRRQGGRRRRAPPVHPVGGEGRARPDGTGRRRRLPGDRHPGHADRR